MILFFLIHNIYSSPLFCSIDELCNLKMAISVSFLTEIKFLIELSFGSFITFSSGLLVRQIMHKPTSGWVFLFFVFIEENLLMPKEKIMHSWWFLPYLEKTFLKTGSSLTLNEKWKIRLISPCVISRISIKNLLKNLVFAIAILSQSTI